MGELRPEQLFAVGYGACFTGALGLAGKAEGIDTSGSTTEVQVGFGPEGDSFGITVQLDVTIRSRDRVLAADCYRPAIEQAQAWGLLGQHKFRDLTKPMLEQGYDCVFGSRFRLNVVFSITRTQRLAGSL